MGGRLGHRLPEERRGQRGARHHDAAHHEHGRRHAQLAFGRGALFRRVNEPKEWGSAFKAATGSEGLSGGAETQTITVGKDGRYSLLMGGTVADGLPLELFTSGEPRWIGIEEVARYRDAGSP